MEQPMVLTNIGEARLLGALGLSGAISGGRAAQAAGVSRRYGLGRGGRAALRGTSLWSGSVAYGTPKPVCAVVKDLRLNCASLAMLRPLRSTDAATTCALQPAFLRPRAVPVRLPPPAFAQTTTSGLRP